MKYFVYFRGFTRRAFNLTALIAFGSLALASPNVNAAAKTHHVLIVGDSLSAGYGLNSGEGWVDLLSKKLDQQKINAKVTNASISGDTTAGGLSRLPALLTKHTPTIVVIELGGNDGLRGSPVPSAKENLQKMTALAQKAGAKVVLLGMRMPPNFGPSYTSAFEAMYRDVSKDSKSALVPFFLEKLGTDLRYFQADRIHPTKEAQSMMLDAVWPTLAGTLK